MTNETLVVNQFIDNDQIAEERTCANCACSIIQEAAGLGKQMFCRKLPPVGKMVRTEVPRIRNGKPDIRDGKPVMVAGEALGFMFSPTMKTLVCFDGWRPLGTLPGDRPETAKLDEYMRSAFKAFDKMNDSPALAELARRSREPMTEEEERQSLSDVLGNDVDRKKN